MKLLAIFISVALCCRSQAFQCAGVLSLAPQKIMNVESISKALKKNFGISLKTDEPKYYGAWNLPEKTLYARKTQHIPQESVLAHELTHVATDLKIEKDPTLSNLARGVIFKAFNSGGDLNERLPYNMIPQGYERFLGFDEVHAVLKEIRVGDAIARRLSDNGDPRLKKFLNINRPLKKQVFKFLAASRFLFRQTLDYLESNPKELSIYYEQRQTLVTKPSLEDYNGKLNELQKTIGLAEALEQMDTYFDTLYDVWVEIEGVNGAPNMMIQLAFHWPGSPEDIPDNSIAYITQIIRQALVDNVKLADSAKALKLITD